MPLLDSGRIQTQGFQRDVVLANVVLGTVQPSPLLEVIGRRDDAQEVVVSLFAELVAPQAADFIGDAEALIRFGSGGAQHVVAVDLGPSGQIAHVAGSNIVVTFRGVGSGTMRVRGHIALAGSTRGHPCTRTRMNGANIAPAANESFDVPDFAAVVRMTRTPQTQAYLYEWLRQNATVVGAGVVAAGVGEQIARVPSDAASLRITNNGAADITGFRAIFELGV